MTDQNVYCNVKLKTIYMHDKIKPETIAHINAILLEFLANDELQDKKKTKTKTKATIEPIKLYINTYGGFIDDMWSLIDLILKSKTPIHTYCTGYAMSAGFQIFLAGHKRFLSEHSKLMYHQISGGTRGTYTDIIQSIPDLTRDQTQIEKYVISRTNIIQEKLDEVREKKLDWYIYPEEALRLGIADTIL